jgi:enoyl-CoA hydratase
MIEIETADGVATLTLNRPEKKNALSIELRDAIADALDELSAHQDVRAIVITGTGDVFSAGFDLDEFAAAREDDALHTRIWVSSDRFHRTVLCCPTPTVAAVNGPAIAGGFDLALMCDLRVAAPQTRFAHPEIAFGDVVYSPLRELVGGAVARELALTGRVVDAEEALRLRLVNRVVPLDEVLPAAQSMASAIAATPREFSRRTKAKIIDRAAINPGNTLDL